jgi:hypothetical protein
MYEEIQIENLQITKGGDVPPSRHASATTQSYRPKYILVEGNTSIFFSDML